MKTFIINLERSQVRRAHIIAEAERCGLNYELFPAIDGSTLTDHELAEYCDLDAIAKYPEWLTPGMIGCALSHYFIYKRIVEDAIAIAFVLEDDMVLPEDLISLLDQIKERIIDSEIVTLHYFGLDGCRLSSQDVEELGDGRSLHFPMNPAEPITTGGYVITNLAARSLLEIIRPVRAAPDSWGFFYENGGMHSFRCIYPIPLRFSGAKSDIHSQSLRGRITSAIDAHRLPGLYQLFRAFRSRRVAKWAKVSFVKSRSPIAEAIKFGRRG